MNSRFVFLISAVSILCFAGILFEQTPPESILLTSNHDPNKSSPQSPVAIDFHDTSLQWGLKYKHTQSSKHLSALSETLGGGVCIFDFNKDGWMDIFFIGGSGHSRHYGSKSWWNKTRGNKLLLNNKGHSFQDITTEAGLDKRILGMACATADMNNDGFSDLLVSGFNGNTLFKNNGDSTFEEITTQSGISNQRWSTGTSLGDYNNDGLLDIYVSNYIRYKKGAKTFEHTSGFQVTNNVAFDPRLYDPEPNQLYINKGGFMFEDVTQKLGVENSLGRSLGAQWVDLNNDHWLDLIVINDHNSPNQVFINKHGLEFSRGKERYASFEVAGAHNLTAADFTNDGSIEYFMTRGMSHPAVFLNDNTSPKMVETDTIYTDEAWSSGLSQAKLLPFTSWGSAAGDFNNDGFQDLYVANGMILPDGDSHFVPQAQKNSLFINKGNGHFKHQKGLSSQQHPYSSRGLVSVDLNNDGKLEIIVSNNNDALQILENKNTNKHAWLGLDLLSQNTKQNLYGAVVEITTDLFTLKRRLGTKQSFLSQSDPRVHIGLGLSKSIKKLNLYWPDGNVSTFDKVSLNQYISIKKEDHSLSPLPQILPSYTSRLQQTLNEQSLTIYSHILMKSPSEKTRNELWGIWHQSTDAVKISILKAIDQEVYHFYISFIRNALESDNIELRLLSIKILKHAELESSIVWLLPLLNDPSPQVQCKATQTFGFFFNEEEAVIHRKMLAISPLIKLLEYATPSVKICAANALAKAENKRAILPLLKLANESTQTEVRMASIRALGLVRDARARNELMLIAQSPESEADIIATALIALYRLSEPSLNTHLLSFFSHKSLSLNTAWFIKRYQVLTLLLTDPDAIVFPKKQLDTMLNRLIFQDVSISKNSLANNSVKLQEAHLSAILTAIGASKLTNQSRIIDIGLKHTKKSIQLQALSALASINTPNAIHLFEQFLENQPLSILKEIITKNRNIFMTFSESFTSQITINAIKDNDFFNDVITLLPQLPRKVANKLFNKLTAQKLSIIQHERLFDLCISNEAVFSITAPLMTNNSRAIYTSERLSYPYLNCLLNSPYLAEEKLTQLEKRLALTTFMADKTQNEHSKVKLLLKAAKVDRVIAKTMLLNHVLSLKPESRSRPDNLKALEILVHQGLTPSIKAQLWEMLKNIQFSNQSRLTAAALLTQVDTESVLNFLNNQFTANDK